MNNCKSVSSPLVAAPGHTQARLIRKAANVQLINLCARAGKKLELNEAGEVANAPAINELAWREPREGWGPMEMNI